MARNRKPWMMKPFRNWMGVVPKPLRSSRKFSLELVPRVERLVAGGAMAKPLWLDAVLAHPPPLTHKFSGERPVRFEWREEDRLRRVWQRRNPEASMHPKVLFLDETQLPKGAAVEHPADTFVREQLKHIRRGKSEEEAYRLVYAQQEERRRFDDAEVAAARETARTVGAVPAVGAAAPDGDSLAARLLRRFAEESRDSGQPYPKHWFNADGSWRGIGVDDALSARTTRALSRQDSLAKLMDEVSLDNREEQDEEEEADDTRPGAAAAGASAEGSEDADAVARAREQARLLGAVPAVGAEEPEPRKADK